MFSFIAGSECEQIVRILNRKVFGAKNDLTNRALVSLNYELKYLTF
jgi:hypothetical protein